MQCLGAFKELRKKLEDTKLKLVRRTDGEKSYWDLVADWNRYPKRKTTDEKDKQDEAGSPPEDWLVCTLPPFALSERTEPVAVVLNFTGTRISENARIQKLREECGKLFDEKEK